MPPPGAPPLFWLMTAPGTWPCSAFSTVGAGTSVTSWVLTTATALAAFCVDTVVATPVTTCCSRRSTSLARAIVYSVLPATTGTVTAV